MIEIVSEDFDIIKIAESGQCFRMNRVDDGSVHLTGMKDEYEIIARDKILRVGQNISDKSQANPEDAIVGELEAVSWSESACSSHIVLDCTQDEYDSFWSEYFDISTDYAGIRNLVDSKDGYLSEAVKTGQGIRILKQDLWEMIVTFLISQQNNIPRIKKCVENICTRYGHRIERSGIFEMNDMPDAFSFATPETTFSFPTPEILAGLDEDALMECNLGYRSKYVVRTARDIVEGKFDLDAIRSMSYEEAKENLLKMYGVGIKVAECVALFALHHVDAFPIDTHIKQVLDREYPQGFDFKRYEGVAGIIQQYIFYYELHKG